MSFFTKKNRFPRPNPAFGLLALFVLFCLIAGVFSPKIDAAESPSHIVVLETMAVPACREHLKWFQAELEELGYRDGENMILTVIHADGDRRQVVLGLKEAEARARPDVVVAIATLASQEAYKRYQGQDIPIFFFQVADPVGAGLVPALGEPTGENITGRVFSVPSEAKINMVMRLIGPKKTGQKIKIGFIHSSYPSSQGDIRLLKEAASKRDDIEFMAYEVEYRKSPEGVPAMLADARRAMDQLEDQVDFWWEPQGPLGELDEFARLLIKNSSRPIVVGQTMKSVELGALLQVTPNLEAGGREAARMADALLKGKDPGLIPVVPPSKFDLGLNLATAMKLEIVPPPDMLELASGHIFR